MDNRKEEGKKKELSDFLKKQIVLYEHSESSALHKIRSWLFKKSLEKSRGGVRKIVYD